MKNRAFWKIPEASGWTAWAVLACERQRLYEQGLRPLRDSCCVRSIQQ